MRIRRNRTSVTRQDDFDRRDFREGIKFDGRWFTPEELHRTCKARMLAFDQLPRKLRDRINEEGR